MTIPSAIQNTRRGPQGQENARARKCPHHFQQANTCSARRGYISVTFTDLGTKKSLRAESTRQVARNDGWPWCLGRLDESLGSGELIHPQRV